MKRKKLMKKRIISIILVVLSLALIILPLASCGGNEKDTRVDDPDDIKSLGYTVTHYATIKIKDYGEIKLELYGYEAPITVENFVNLANSGFYDGLVFHRIMSDFMIQGGGFNKDGSEKDAPSIKGEFYENGIINQIEHVRGVISMARTDVMDSASSQFFIMHKTSPHLDGSYAAFGKVIKGMYVVDEICDSVKQGYNGAVALKDRPVIESITIEEVK